MNVIEPALLELLRTAPKKQRPKGDVSVLKIEALAKLKSGEYGVLDLGAAKYVDAGDYFADAATHTVLTFVYESALVGASRTLIKELMDAATTYGLRRGMSIGFILYIQSRVVKYAIPDPVIDHLTRDHSLTLTDYQNADKFSTIVGKTMSPESVGDWLRTASPDQPIQVFFADDSGISSTNTKLRSTRISALTKALAGKPNRLFIHSPLDINTAKIDAYLRWHLLDFKDARNLGARGVVVHCGSNGVGLPDHIAELDMLTNMKRLLETASDTCPLLIENPAGETNDMCVGPDALVKFYGKFTAEEQKRVGFCIDTQHAFSASYDPLYYLKYVNDRLPGKIKLVHYNDSQICKGGCHDLHMSIGGKGFGFIRGVVTGGVLPKISMTGVLGEIGIRTMVEVAMWCRALDIPMVTETSKTDE